MDAVYKELSRAAVLGSGGAWDALGYLHDAGKGLAPSPSKAAECWRKGSDLDHDVCQVKLAKRLETVTKRLTSLSSKK